MGRLTTVQKKSTLGWGKAMVLDAPTDIREAFVDGLRTAHISVPQGYFLIVMDADGAVDIADEASLTNDYDLHEVTETPEFVLGADPQEERELNSTFVVHPTRPALVTYTTKIVASATVLAGTQVGRIELLVGAGSPPTDVADVHEHGISGVSVAIEIPSTRQMVALVPPGHAVRLATTITSGTPSFELVAYRERIL